VDEAADHPGYAFGPGSAAGEGKVKNMNPPYKIRCGSPTNPMALVLTDPTGKMVPGQRTTELFTDSEGRMIFRVEFLVGMTKYGLQPHLGKTIRPQRGSITA
jgi:hypothetical protein